VKTAHLRVDDSESGNGTRRAELEMPDGESKSLFFTHHDGALTTESGANPFLLGFFLSALERGHNVHVHGPASEQLLVNLEELQEVWHKWNPATYKRITIDADSLLPLSTDSQRSAIAAFSGGVDAAFSVHQHLGGSLGRARANIRSALLVHGFDIPLDQRDVFESTRKRAEMMLSGTGIVVRSVATNFRQLGQHWESAFGLAVAATLSLFEGSHRIGIIGSSEPYDALVLPWGSSPVTDHLYSSDGMHMRHEGAGYSRTEKVGELLSRPEMIKYLRVCWAGEVLDRNCGACEKCVRTLLNFRVFGVDNPACFDNSLTPELISTLEFRNDAIRNEFASILLAAHARGVDEWWTRQLAKQLHVAQQPSVITKVRRNIRRKVEATRR